MAAKKVLFSEIELKKMVWIAALTWDGIDINATTAVLSTNNPYVGAVALNCYGGNEEPKIFRPMTKEEAISCNSGGHIWFIGANDGTARRAKVNGVVKTWKTRPGLFRMPIKVGMYEYGYFTNDDLPRMLVPLRSDAAKWREECETAECETDV